MYQKIVYDLSGLHLCKIDVKFKIMWVCVCVCVRERERERDKRRQGHKTDSYIAQ